MYFIFMLLSKFHHFNGPRIFYYASRDSLSIFIIKRHHYHSSYRYAQSSVNKNIVFDKLYSIHGCYSTLEKEQRLPTDTILNYLYKEGHSGIYGSLDSLEDYTFNILLKQAFSKYLLTNVQELELVMKRISLIRSKTLAVIVLESVLGFVRQHKIYISDNFAKAFLTAYLKTINVNRTWLILSHFCDGKIWIDFKNQAISDDAEKPLNFNLNSTDSEHDMSFLLPMYHDLKRMQYAFDSDHLVQIFNRLVDAPPKPPLYSVIQELYTIGKHVPYECSLAALKQFRYYPPYEHTPLKKSEGSISSLYSLKLSYEEYENFLSYLDKQEHAKMPLFYKASLPYFRQIGMLNRIHELEDHVLSLEDRDRGTEDSGQVLLGLKAAFMEQLFQEYLISGSSDDIVRLFRDMIIISDSPFSKTFKMISSISRDSSTSFLRNIEELVLNHIGAIWPSYKRQGIISILKMCLTLNKMSFPVHNELKNAKLPHSYFLDHQKLLLRIYYRLGDPYLDAYIEDLEYIGSGYWKNWPGFLDMVLSLYLESRDQKVRQRLLRLLLSVFKNRSEVVVSIPQTVSNIIKEILHTMSNLTGPDQHPEELFFTEIWNRYQKSSTYQEHEYIEGQESYSSLVRHLFDGRYFVEIVSMLNEHYAIRALSLFHGSKCWFPIAYSLMYLNEWNLLFKYLHSLVYSKRVDISQVSKSNSTLSALIKELQWLEGYLSRNMLFPDTYTVKKALEDPKWNQEEINSTKGIDLEHICKTTLKCKTIGDLRKLYNDIPSFGSGTDLQNQSATPNPNCSTLPEFDSNIKDKLQKLRHVPAKLTNIRQKAISKTVFRP
jgi:hypothetical protein